MDDTLILFAREALAKGISKEEIHGTLVEAGWPDDEVVTALGSFADIDFPVPVPRPKPYLSARDAFTYLVLFALLYTSAWGLGALLFQFVNQALPDPAAAWATQDLSLQVLRWAISALLIAFPGFMMLSRRAHLAGRRDPERRTSKIRKWLTYLTLFLAAAILLGDLITLVFNLLEGELTTRFLLKALAVGAIAGSVFGYYLWDLRQADLKPEELPPKYPGLRWFAGTVGVVVTISLIGGFVVAGSPGSARQLQLDNRREQELHQISLAIDSYWRERKALPATLDELSRTRRALLHSIRDPESEEPYEYRITGPDSYEICATFSTDDVDEPRRPYFTPYRDGQRFWSHGPGRTCFRIELRHPPGRREGATKDERSRLEEE